MLCQGIVSKRKDVYSLTSLFLTLLLLFTSFVVPVQADISGPSGFDGKVYDATMALFAQSPSHSPDYRFLCTVTAFRRVEGGYLLIGAGHCTSANPDLPTDLNYAVAPDFSTTGHKIQLIKSVMDEPLDYAVYFYPTNDVISVIELGNESKSKIGEKTVDVNFSLGAAKIVSEGKIASKIAKKGEAKDFFLDTMMASHGASGSAVVSEKSHKIIGLLIAGWDGATMPSICEPITRVEAELAKLDLPKSVD